MAAVLPVTADVTREPTGGQGLREAAELLYPGLFPDEAYRRHPGQIDRVAALIADADNWRRATTGDPTEPEPLAMQARTLLLQVWRVRDLADELDVHVAARGKPATGSYDDGVNRAQANAAARIRHALDGEPQP